MMASRAAPVSASRVATPAISTVVHQVLASPGRRLDAADRRRFESYFQQDFSQVAVHTDQEAAESARLLGSRAYTVGNQVVFAHGQYQPATLAGRGLLAHELAHVKQQGGRPPDRIRPLDLQPPSTAAEERADRAAEGMASGGQLLAVSDAGNSVADRLQRQGPTPLTIPTAWSINLSIDEKGRVDVTVAGPSTTPIVSKPTIGIRRDADGQHYHLLVGGRDKVVTADQIPEMLRSIGGTKPGETPTTRRLIVPTCDQLAGMANKFENYEVSRKLLEVPGIPIEMLPLTPELFDALVTACAPKPATAPAGPPATPDLAFKVSPPMASVLGSDTLDNFGFDDRALTSAHIFEIDEVLGPRLKSLLSQYPLGVVSVTGHTDEVGADPYNKALGEARAESVRDRLGTRIPLESITMGSAGKSEPVVRTGKADGRNRRVEIRFSTGPRFRGFGLELSPPEQPARTTTPPGPSSQSVTEPSQSQPSTQPAQSQPVQVPPASQGTAPPLEGGEAEPPESHIRITVQLTPQHTFPIRGANAAQCGDWISFPAGVMWNWDGIPLAGEKLQLFSQPEVDWDLVQVMCGKPGNVLIQDNLLKWNIFKDILEASLVGQVSIVQGSDVALQPGLQLSWHPLTSRGGNKELQLIFGTSLNWQPGPRSLGLVIGGGIRFEFPH